MENVNGAFKASPENANVAVMELSGTVAYRKYVSDETEKYQIPEIENEAEKDVVETPAPTETPTTPTVNPQENTEE